MEQILNLPAHRTLHCRGRSRKLLDEGQLLPFVLLPQALITGPWLLANIMTQAPWADSLDAGYIAGCFCLPPEQKAGLHIPRWSVCRALCRISKVTEGATCRRMARISASLACVGGVGTGSFSLRGHGGTQALWRN